MKKSGKNSNIKKWLAGAAAALVLAGGSAVALSGGASNVATAATPAPVPKSDLEERLAASGSDTINVSGDVSLSGLAYVNGDKTLTGTGRILAENGEQYILVINDGASLTLDGPVLDGTNSAENGVYVSPDASFDMEAGSIENLKGHGVRVLGEAEINGGTIESVGTNWIMVDEGAELDVSGAKFSDAGDIGIITGADSGTELKNVTLADAKGNLIYNGGEMEIEGGSFTGAEDYAIHNDAKLDVSGVDFAGAKTLGYIENAKTGECQIDGGSMTDSRADFIYNQGVLDVSNVKFDGCSGSAIESKSTAADVSVYNCTFDNIGKSVALIKGGEMDMEDVKAGSCGDCFIHNYGMNFNGRNISVEDVDNIAFYNDFDTSNVSCGNFYVDGFEIGHAASYGIRNDGGKMVLSNGTVGKCDSYGMYAKDGEIETDRVSFLGTTDPGRGVVQIGYTSGNTHAVVKMYDTDITGGARGITNHDTCYFYSGNIYGNTSGGDVEVGGAINNDGTFYLYGGTISFNHAVGSGGAIYNSGTLEVYCPAVIAYNITERYGGGIYSNGAMAFYGGVVYNNSSIEGGGGIFNGGIGDLFYGSVYNNYTAGSGGGVYTGGSGKTNISGLNIYSNTASKSGGGAYTLGSTTLGAGTTISGNVANNYGGGAATGNSSDGTKHGSMLIDGAVITGNTANSGGGGVYNPSRLTMSSGEISGNTSAANGGGMYITSNGTTTITGGTISGNNATSAGGGIHNLGNTSVSGVTIYANTAGTNGGGISNGTANSGQEGQLSIGNAYITENTASNKGGGVYNNGTASITGGVVSGNVGGSEAESGVHTAKALSLSGDPSIDSIHKTSAGTVNVGTLSGTDTTTLYLDNYDIGTEAITGSTAAEKDHFTLPQAQVDDGKFIADDGTIGGTAKKVASVDGTEYESVAAAIAAIADTETKTGTIKLLDNVEEAISIPAGTNITLDMDGKTLDAGNTATAIDVRGAFTLTGNGTVTNGKGSYGGGVYVRSGGSMNFVSGTISNCDGGTRCGGIYVGSNASLNMTGGTITGCTGNTNYTALYVYGTSGNTSAITVSGGNIDGTISKSTNNSSISLTGGTYSYEPKDSYVADGYEKAASGDKWIVQEKAEEPGTEYVAQIGSDKYETIEEALQAAVGKTVTIELLKDVTLQTRPTMTSDTTITFTGGKTLTIKPNYAGLYKVDGCTLTINGGYFACTVTNTSNRYIAYMANNGALIVNGGTFTGSTKAFNGSGTATITGGTFGFDPTSYVPATGYIVTNNGDSTWTVTKTVSAEPPIVEGSLPEGEIPEIPAEILDAPAVDESAGNDEDLAPDDTEEKAEADKPEDNTAEAVADETNGPIDRIVEDIKELFSSDEEEDENK